MKRIIIIIMFFLTNFIYGGDYYYNNSVYADVLENGDLNELNWTIQNATYQDNQNIIYHYRFIWGFVQLNKTGLRLLRNTIYAKHGYIFNSPDLQEHFSQFSWYVGTKNNVDNELTENEKIIIDYIRRIENNYPLYIYRELIGYWIAKPYNGTFMRLYPNGIFYYYSAIENVSYHGFWFYENNILQLNINFEEINIISNFNFKGVNSGYIRYSNQKVFDDFFQKWTRESDYADYIPPG
jgi:hypothetical protein